MNVLAAVAVVGLGASFTLTAFALTLGSLSWLIFAGAIALFSLLVLLVAHTRSRR